ncbi:unnamed protein product, partial [Candidula unifasciata]
QSEIKDKGKALSAANFDNTWQNRQLFSLPTRLIESPDQSMENVGGIPNCVTSGSQSHVDSQTHFKVVFRTPDSTKTQSQTLTEDILELDKPELQKVIKYFTQRPHTAHGRFSKEDLEAAFEASMIKYKQLL